SRPGRREADLDAEPVARDDVSRTGRTADRVVVRPAGQADAVGAVAHGRGAVDVEADIVALYDRPGRGPGDDEAERSVAGDDVPCRSGAADDRVGGAATDGHAGQTRVAEGAGAGGVDADEVPPDRIARRTRPGDENAGEI